MPKGASATAAIPIIVVCNNSRRETAAPSDRVMLSKNESATSPTSASFAVESGSRPAVLDFSDHDTAPDELVIFIANFQKTSS